MERKGSKYGNPVVIYLLLLLVYYITYILTPVDYSGSSENYTTSRMGPQLLSMVMILYSTFFLIKNNARITQKPLFNFLLFFAYAIVSYLILIITGISFNLYFFSNILKIGFWIIPLYLFAIYFRHVAQQTKILTAFISIYLCYIAILMALQYGHSEAAEITGAGNGGAIFYICPLIFTIPNKRLASWFYFIAFALAIVSAKRTPILMMSIPLLFFGLQIFKKFKMRDILIMLILAIGGVVTFLSQFTNMLIERNQIDAASGAYGSGRAIFYQIVLEGWFNADIFHFLFGFGIGAVNQLLLSKFGIAISAHSGFLDVLYSYGLIGMVIYLSIFYSLWKYRTKVKKYTPALYKPFIMFIFMWFSQNFIIHGFAGPQFICYTIFIGYVISKVNFAKVQYIQNLKIRKKYTYENCILHPTII